MLPHMDDPLISMVENDLPCLVVCVGISSNREFQRQMDKEFNIAKSINVQPVVMWKIFVRYMPRGFCRRGRVPQGLDIRRNNPRGYSRREFVQGRFFWSAF